ncbi:hypothetical protein HY988_02465 [Candidatus Micrarchaeota archaeon]|nr:hypothetical protein [Candidatus Micrarchaeota archaeon]
MAVQRRIVFNAERFGQIEVALKKAGFVDCGKNPHTNLPVLVDKPRSSGFRQRLAVTSSSGSSSTEKKGWEYDLSVYCEVAAPKDRAILFALRELGYLYNRDIRYSGASGYFPLPDRSCPCFGISVAPEVVVVSDTFHLDRLIEASKQLIAALAALKGNTILKTARDAQLSAQELRTHSSLPMGNAFGRDVVAIVRLSQKLVEKMDAAYDAGVDFLRVNAQISDAMKLVCPNYVSHMRSIRPSEISVRSAAISKSAHL